MDPVSALSVAASLLTFAQVGCQLFANVKHIHQSADGQSKSNRDLSTHAERLASLCSDLETKARTPHDLYVGVDDPALSAVFQRCIDTSQELQRALERVAAKPHQLWPSVRAAVRTVLSESDIQDLERRLARCTSEVQSSLLAALHSQNSVLQVRLDAIRDGQQRMHLQSRHDLERLRDDLVRALSNTHQTLNAGQLTAIDHDLGAMRESLDSECLQLVVLNNLDFPERTARSRIIRDRHQDTFDWVFEPSHAGLDVKFTEWLRADANLFWITGKAGSGKSTMLKYVSGHPKTLQRLRDWTGESELATAEFFFWNAGSFLEKSLQGLLRSLLFQLCSQQPKLTTAFWESTAPYKHDLGNKECLLYALEQLTSVPDMSSKFCFFIDGVDEFLGEPREIAQAIKAIASIPSVKVCCSSRPWNAFESGFARSNGFVLAIHQHTRNDIAGYVADTLRKDPDFVELLAFDADYALVADEILKRAEGVFLWVYLVVSSLLDVLANKDSPNELLQRVREMPGDLEGMYRYILDRIDERYRRQSAILLRLVTHAEAPLPIMAAEYVSQGDFNLLEMPLKDWSPADQYAYSSIVRSKVKARCLDLVEADPPDMSPSSQGAGWTLKLLHRTVYDYLMSKDTQQLLESRIGTNALTPRQELCRAYVYLLKTLPLQSISGNLGTDREATCLVRQLLAYAQPIENWAMPLLREAEHTMNAQVQREGITGFCFPGESAQPAFELSPHTTNLLFPYAIAMAMTYYVSRCLEENPSLVRDVYGVDALVFICHGLSFHAGNTTPDYSNVAGDLLRHGADASEILENAEESLNLISRCRSSSIGVRREMIPLLEVFVRHGYLEVASTPKSLRVNRNTMKGGVSCEGLSLDDLGTDDIKRLEAAAPASRQAQQPSSRSVSSKAQSSRSRLSLRQALGALSSSIKR